MTPEPVIFRSSRPATPLHSELGVSAVTTVAPGNATAHLLPLLPKSGRGDSVTQAAHPVDRLLLSISRSEAVDVESELFCPTLKQQAKPCYSAMPLSYGRSVLPLPETFVPIRSAPSALDARVKPCSCVPSPPAVCEAALYDTRSYPRLFSFTTIRCAALHYTTALGSHARSRARLSINSQISTAHSRARSQRYWSSFRSDEQHSNILHTPQRLERGPHTLSAPGHASLP